MKLRWQLLLIICLLASLSGQTLAQETTPEPEETPVVIPTEEVTPPIEIPTDIPVPTESPTDVPVSTEMPTAEVTPDIPTPTTVPEEPTSLPVTPTPSFPSEPVLSLLAREMFDGGDLSAWTLGPTWLLVPDEAGLNLQTAVADGMQFNRGPFFNAAAQISLKLAGGSIHLALHQTEVGSYSAALDASGLVTLYRAGVPVQSVAVALLPDTWQTLRLSVMNGVLRVAVNGVEVLAWQDTAPLPPGLVSITAYPPPDGSAFTVQVDNFFLWVPETEVSLYPAPTAIPEQPTLPPLEPTAVVTAEPTAETPVPTAEVTAEPTQEVTVVPTVEATAEITAEPTAVITAEPTAEATPLVDPMTGKSLVYQTHIPSAVIPATVNDKPVDALTVSPLPYEHSGNTAGDDLEGEDALPTPGCGFNLNATTWYKFTPGVTKQYVIHTAGSAFDTILVLYNNNANSSGPGSEKACNDDATATDRTSRLALSLTGGQTYWIRLGGYNGDDGNYVFTVIDPSLAAPPAPRLSSPAANQNVNTRPPNFQWLAPASGAAPAYYEIQIGTTATLTPLLHSFIVPASQLNYNAYTFGQDGVYYWRVRSLNANKVGGAWTTAWKLTIDTVDPVAPVLKTPLDATIVTATRPTLTWNTVSGATKYRVQLQVKGSSNQLLTAAKAEVTTPSLALTSTAVLPAPLQHGLTYEWYVVALDAAGNDSPASDTWEFTVNLMNAPAADAGLKPVLPVRQVFTWYTSGIAGARYEVQVAANEADLGTANDKVCTSATTTCTLPVGQELAAGTYYWRLLVLISGAPQNSDVPVRSFTLSSTALPAAPIPTGPANAKPTNAPILAWKGPIGGPFPYQMQLATDKTFPNTPLTDVANGILEFTPGGLTNGLTYFWRVRALNADGAPGPWSAVWSFLFDTEAPTGDNLKPGLVTPANHATFTGPLPRFTWKAVTGYTRYEIQVAKLKPAPVSSCDDNTNWAAPSPLGFAVSTTSFTPPGPLLYTNYCWRVHVLDAAGNPGPWGDAFEVKVISAATAVPILNRFETHTPTLNWTPISWAKAYEVQISYNSTFTSLVPGVPLVSGNPLPTQLTLTAGLALPNGTYYWRVRAQRQDNTWGAWSTGGTGTFQVDATP